MTAVHDAPTPGQSLTIDDIRTASRIIEGVVLRTPILPAPQISTLTGVDIYVKYENLQATHSFKDRGAMVKMSRLPQEVRERGVIAMSAGNHAQAVAYHAKRLGIPATIVMPVTTPLVKVRATEAHGARIVLDGETLAESQIRVQAIIAEENLTLVHPYDDPDIIAGQGTVGLEMLEDVPDLDVLVVPIGGGGLISGIALAAKAINPKIEIIGVQAAKFPCTYNAVTGEHLPVGGSTLAEGISVKNVGQLTLPIIRSLVSEILLVTEPYLERAVNAFATLQTTMAEGAGAAGLAAVLMHPEKFRGRKTGLVLCGGNIDPRILAAIMMRELEREDRIIAFRLTINDQPGVLGQISTKLGELGANILEISHRRLYLDVPAKGAILDVTVEARDAAHARAIEEALSAFEGIPCRRIDAGGSDVNAR